MSRIGKKPVRIPDKVQVEAKSGHIKVTGPLGSSELDLHPGISIKVDESAKEVSVVNEKAESRQANQMHGTTRALIANMVKGVSKGFETKMEIYGTGFSVNEQGGKLVFQVGFCNPVERKIPQGVKVKIEAKATRGNDVPATFTLTGADKCLVGQFAAEIYNIRPPEPYKGKGIRYAGERVRRKVGKAFTSGAA
jgi:large subunit ribosomal protein L6